jgi:hypothetical protein
MRDGWLSQQGYIVDIPGEPLKADLVWRNILDLSNFAACFNIQLHKDDKTLFVEMYEYGRFNFGDGTGNSTDGDLKTLKKGVKPFGDCNVYIEYAEDFK